VVGSRWSVLLPPAALGDELVREVHGFLDAFAALGELAGVGLWDVEVAGGALMASRSAPRKRNSRP